jgi:hypothetical protein
MAARALIPDNESVYRGMSKAAWCRQGIVTYEAFLLRPATVMHPIPEAELSLGRSAVSAVDELNKHYGAAILSVACVHALVHNLRVLPEADDATKAEMHGLPLFSTDPVQRDLAVTMATDLAGLATWVPVPQPN